MKFVELEVEGKEEE